MTSFSTHARALRTTYLKKASCCKIKILLYTITAIIFQNHANAHETKTLNSLTSLERKNYPFLAQPVGPYVHAVKHNNTLYLSGLTAFETESQTQTIENQAKEIFQQMTRVAESEGSSLKNLIKVTLYVTDLNHMNKLREMLYDIYGAHIPASSLIKIDRLFSDDLKIEIEAIIAL